MERSEVSGTRLDYFGARYMSAVLGRFVSPDEPFLAQEPNDPTSWNPYSYTGNQPLARVDPPGYNWYNIDGQWQWQEGGAYLDSSGNPCKKGSSACGNGFTHLIVFEITRQDRKTKAAHGKLTLCGNDGGKALLESDVFSGGPGKKYKPAGLGNYSINLAYSVLGRSDILANSSDPRYVAWRRIMAFKTCPPRFSGPIRRGGGSGPGSTPPPGGAGLPDEMKGLFLHGSFDFLDYTNGCLCERRETILRWLRDAAQSKRPWVSPSIPVNIRYRQR